MKGSKFYHSSFITLLTLIISYNYVWAQPANSDDEEAIKSVIKGLSDAWEKADGTAWGSYFTEEADFTVWFGLHLEGRLKISEGHQWVFDSVYPDTRYELEITNLKFLKSDIAVVHLDGSIIEPGDSLPEDPHTFPVAVLQKLNDKWKIVMFHNMKNRIKEINNRRAKGDPGDVRKG